MQRDKKNKQKIYNFNYYLIYYLLNFIINLIFFLLYFNFSLNVFIIFKLKFVESATDGASTKTVEEEEKETPVIGINLRNNDLSQMLKPVILNLYDTCVLLRNWIVLLIPKVEDGNNFGVEVQEQCLTQLKSRLKLYIYHHRRGSRCF